MIIEENDVSSFKKWLCINLKDVADAEPEILSNYIYALIKDDPSKEECISKLEDFLYEETVPFVNKIFQALKTKEYLDGGSDRRRVSHENDYRRSGYEQPKRSREEDYRRHSPKREPEPERNYQRRHSPQQERYPRRNSPDDRSRHRRDSPERRDSKPKYKSKRSVEEDERKNKKPYEKRREPTEESTSENKNTMLTVSNIPPELNTIDTLNSHFKKFGSIIKKELKKADIQFGSNREAYLAWKSPDAVLENRFIKVFWYKEPSEQEEKEATEKKVQKKPVFVPKPALVFIPKPGFPKGTDAQKEKKIQTLLTSTQQNLDMQLQTYKELVTKLESMEDSEEKVEMTKKLKVLFDNLQTSMLAQQKTVEEAKLKREEEKRKREENKESTEPEENPSKKVKVETDSQTSPSETEPSTTTTTTVPSFRGGFRGRGRGTTWTRGTTGRPSFNLDNRTTTFIVRNVPQDSQNENAIRQHFQNFGTITSLKVESDGSAIVEFDKRKSAEMAIVKGKFIGENKLEFSWKNKTSEVTGKEE